MFALLTARVAKVEIGPMVVLVPCAPVHDMLQPVNFRILGVCDFQFSAGCTTRLRRSRYGTNVIGMEKKAVMGSKKRATAARNNSICDMLCRATQTSHGAHNAPEAQKQTSCWFFEAIGIQGVHRVEIERPNFQACVLVLDLRCFCRTYQTYKYSDKYNKLRF